MQTPSIFNDILLSGNFLDVLRTTNEAIGDPACWWSIDTDLSIHPLEDETLCQSPADWPPASLEECHRQSLAQYRQAAAGKPCLFEKVTDELVQAVLPFFHQGQLLGAIAVCFRENSSRRAAVELLHRYIQIFSGFLTQYDDLEFVHDIWQQMVSSTTLEQLLPRILQETLHALHSNHGVFFLVDDDGLLSPRINSLGKMYGHLTPETPPPAFPYLQRVQEAISLVLHLDSSDPLARLTHENLHPKSEWPQWNQWQYLAIPLRNQEQLLGLVVLQSKSAGKPLLHEEKMLEIITDGATAVLDNALTQDKNRQRSLALSTIHTVHRLMGSAPEPTELLEKIARLVTQLLHVRKCSIMQVDFEKSRLSPVATLGLHPGEIGTCPLLPGQGLPGLVLESYEPMIVQSPLLDQRFANQTEQIYPEKSYLAVPMIDEDLVGVITASGRNRPFTPADREILMTLAEQAVIALRNVQLIEQHQNMVLHSLRSIANLIEMRDPYSKGHTQRVEELAMQLGRKISDDPEWLTHLQYAALLHDSGKVGIMNLQPAARVRKSASRPTRMEEPTDEHPGISVQIARSMQLDNQVLDIIRHHHENFDGTGYPAGLKGEEIPLGARVLAIANAYASIEAKGGGHRPDYSPTQIFAILHKVSKRKFDSRLLEQFRQTFDADHS